MIRFCPDCGMPHEESTTMSNFPPNPLTTKNIFAYTAHSHPYPPFISINERPQQVVEIHVRQAGEAGMRVAHMQIPFNEVVAMRDALTKYIEQRQA